VKFLLIEAEFYKGLADKLAKVAVNIREAAGYAVERVKFPDVLEIPIALSAMFEGSKNNTASVVVFGCITRGEALHYDIISNETMSALIRSCTKHKIPLGNGIFTVEGKEEVWLQTALEQKIRGQCSPCRLNNC